MKPLSLKKTQFYFPLLSVVVVFFSACKGEDKTSELHEKHSHEKHSHSANEFSDQSTVEKLAKKFESAERDSAQQPQKILHYLGDLQGKTIMDIGAGTGYFSVKLADKGANVIAADVSSEFQDYLKQRLEKDKLKNIELRKIPYDSPFLKDAEVDMIFVANTYHHIENRVDYFTRAKKGIKKGGELIILDYFKTDMPDGPPTNMKVSIDEVIAELKKAGYTSFEAEVNLLPYQYILRAK